MSLVTQIEFLKTDTNYFNDTNFQIMLAFRIAAFRISIVLIFIKIIFLSCYMCVWDTLPNIFKYIAFINIILLFCNLYMIYFSLHLKLISFCARLSISIHLFSEFYNIFVQKQVICGIFEIFRLNMAH